MIQEQVGGMKTKYISDYEAACGEEAYIDDRSQWEKNNKRLNFKLYFMFIWIIKFLLTYVCI